MERLSTGKKINSAADDAAGFAIAESMTAQIRGLTMATKNASDALGLLRVVENATNDVTDMLQRIRSLAVQAQSDTNSSSDKQYLQKEAEALFKEIDRVSSDTSYNNVAYLGTGSASVNVQVGYNDGNTISITTYNITSGNLGTADVAADVAPSPLWLVLMPMVTVTLPTPEIPHLSPLWLVLITMATATLPMEQHRHEALQVWRNSS